MYELITKFFFVFFFIGNYGVSVKSFNNNFLDINFDF